MFLKNDFDETDRAVYAFEHECFVCGSNQCVELHHILGRISKSICNSVMLCRHCHERYTTLDKGFLLRGTMKFLMKEEYDLKPRDLKFYLNNKKLYDK